MFYLVGIFILSFLMSFFCHMTYHHFLLRRDKKCNQKIDIDDAAEIFHAMELNIEPIHHFLSNKEGVITKTDMEIIRNLKK